VLGDSCEGFRITQGADAAETVLEIDGAIDPVAVRQLEDRIWEHFDVRHQHSRHLAPDQFGEFTDGVLRTHHSDPLALVQLLLVHRILSATERPRRDDSRPAAARTARPSPHPCLTRPWRLAHSCQWTRRTGDYVPPGRRKLTIDIWRIVVRRFL
jgi:hypothetical protein